LPSPSSLFANTRALFERHGGVFLFRKLDEVSQEDALAALHPEERALCSGMCAARRHEFAAGRLLAREAFALLAAQSSPRQSERQSAFARARPLLRGQHGEPLWPEGSIGSLTHTKDAAALAAVPDDRASVFLGIDLERLDRGISDPAWEHILSPPEEAFFRGLEAESGEGLRATYFRLLIFSAKESLYKALFPASGTYFGFQDASAIDLMRRFSADESASSANTEPSPCGRFTLVLERELGARFPKGMEFACQYEIGGGYVLTSVIPEK
jgi:4'-phosphopantetheinyl transferase EntD